MAAYKMTKAIRTKMAASQRLRYAQAKAKTKSAKRGRAVLNAHASRLVNDLQQDETPKVIAGEYVGERAVQDINKIEDRAFRRGLFTGLQMVVDLLIRELR